MRYLHRKSQLSRRAHQAYLGGVADSLPSLVACASAALLLSACAMPPAEPDAAVVKAPAPSPDDERITQYLATLEQAAAGERALSPGNLAAADAPAPTASSRLHHALALGSAGHAGSDPAEAGRMLADLLNSAHGLTPAEISLAQAFRREFEARTALRTVIDQERLDFAQQMKTASAEDNRRIAALSTENARLRKALADAERKLSAVAEIERSLLESEAPATEAPPPQ